MMEHAVVVVMMAITVMHAESGMAVMHAESGIAVMAMMMVMVAMRELVGTISTGGG